MRPIHIGYGLLGLFILFLLYITKALLWLAFAAPALIAFAVVLGIGAWILFKGDSLLALLGGGSIIAFGWALLTILLIWGYNAGMVKNYQQPELTSEIGVLWPRATAYERAQKLLAGEVGNDSTTGIGDIDSGYDSESRRFFWRAGKTPSGKLNPVINQINTIVELWDDEHVFSYDQTFVVGEKMYFFDNIAFRLMLERYSSWSPDTDVFYWQIPETEELVTIAPLVHYERYWLSFVTVWDGAMVVYPDGEMEYLSVRQAETDPRFENAQTYPSSLIEPVIDNLCFRFGGLGNCWFQNQMKFDIPQLPYSENEQPYFTVYNWEPVWAVTLDPNGATNESWTYMVIQDVDSRTWQLVDMRSHGSLRGPVQAMSQIVGAASNLVWTDENGGGTFLPLEPRPAITEEETIYWLTTVTNKNFRAEAALALVNADNTDEIFFFCSVDGMYDFLAGESTRTDTLPCDSSSTLGAGKSLSEMSDQELLQYLVDLAAEMQSRSSGE